MYRRSTLGAAGTANNNNNDAPSTGARGRPSIAVPSRTGGTRPSSSQSSSQPLASSQQSQGSYGAVPATVGRTGSTYGSSNAALGYSGARGDAGQLRSSYAPSTTVRRSSVYTASVPTIGNNNHLQNTTMRRQSTMPGGTMGPGGVAATPGAHRFAPSSRLMKDPRPVKDRAFQKKCRDDITQFLEARGYTQAFSERTLINPTTKDFQEIFRFIHNAYEGRITNNLNLAKKFEDEVPQLLRAAGYPFAADITKSHLQAIGAQHSWPGMLAMLHWFVQVINAREQAFLAYQDIHIDPSQLDTPQAMSRVQYRTEMWAEYLSTSYPIFMASPDYDIETQKRKLVDRYEAAGEATRTEIMQATEELERLTAQYEAQCRQGSNIEKAKEEEKRLEVDIHKMEEYLGRLEAGIKKYSVRCEEFRKKIADLEQQEKCAIIEREKVTKIVEEQNLSEVDVHRLTSDRHTLDSKLKTARMEREEKSKRTYELEVKRSQAFSTIERLVEEYEAKATKLGLIPHPPQGYEHIDFRQELNGAASIPSAMVPDCITQIKPAISRLKQDAIGARREEEDKVLSVEEELLDLRDKIASRAADYEDADTRYKALMKELTNAKDSLSNEMTAAYAELERLQSQCTSIRVELSGGLLAAEQRLQALRNEHDKLMSDVEKLRRDNQEAFAHQLEAIVTYKDYVFMRVDEMAVEVGL